MRGTFRGASSLESLAARKSVTGAHIKQGDSVLQSWRIRKAAPYIPRRAHVLDIGCSDGALFRVLGDRIAAGAAAALAADVLEPPAPLAVMDENSTFLSLVACAIW